MNDVEYKVNLVLARARELIAEKKRQIRGDLFGHATSNGKRYDVDCSLNGAILLAFSELVDGPETINYARLERLGRGGSPGIAYLFDDLGRRLRSSVQRAISDEFAYEECWHAFEQSEYFGRYKAIIAKALVEYKPAPLADDPKTAA